MITKIINHIWIQGYSEMNTENKNNIRNIKRLNPNWITIVWDDQSIRSLLYNKYPEILQFYDNTINLPGSINYLASKSDIARYVIMYEHGGCYMDVDVECIDGLDSIIKGLPNKEDIFACAEKYGRYSDAFFISNPNNHIVGHIVENIIKCRDKQELGNNMSNTIKFNKYNVYVLKDVSNYHCGSSYKCMIPIKINSNDDPLHPRRILKYVCDKRTEFMIAFAVIISILLIFIISFIAYKCSNRRKIK